MKTLPAGYRFEKFTGSRWELRGPGECIVTNMIKPDDPDAELIAQMHWTGYRAGVIAALNAVRRAADEGGGIARDSGQFDTIRHDLLYQIHIV